MVREWNGIGEAPWAKLRRNLGISLSPWSSKNPDNFTARTRAIYGRVYVTVAELLSLQLTFFPHDENISGKRRLLYVFRSNMLLNRVIVLYYFVAELTVCTCTRVQISFRTRAPAVLFPCATCPALSCQRYKFLCALRLRSTFTSIVHRFHLRVKKDYFSRKVFSFLHFNVTTNLVYYWLHFTEHMCILYCVPYTIVKYWTIYEIYFIVTIILFFVGDLIQKKGWYLLFKRLYDTQSYFSLNYIHRLFKTHVYVLLRNKKILFS